MTNDATVQAAHTAAVATRSCLTGQMCGTDFTGIDLGGLMLGPGIYCWSAAAGLTGTLTLTAPGNYVFQIGSTLTTAASSTVSAAPGAKAYWSIGSSATFGTSSTFYGEVYAAVSITMTTSATITGGGLYALSGAVTLDTNTVTG